MVMLTEDDRDDEAAVSPCMRLPMKHVACASCLTKGIYDSM
jgi:hypothetical protein